MLKKSRNKKCNQKADLYMFEYLLIKSKYAMLKKIDYNYLVYLRGHGI